MFVSRHRLIHRHLERLVGRKLNSAQAMEQALSEIELRIDHADAGAEAALRARSLAQVLHAVPLSVQIHLDDCDEPITSPTFPRNDSVAGILIDRARRRIMDDFARLSKVEATEIVEVAGPPKVVYEVIVRTITGAFGTLSSEPGADQIRFGGVTVTVRDITERHRLDVMRRDFISNVSHELRTPVGAISVLAETLVDEPDPEIAKRLILRLEREAQRLAESIDDLLALNRVENNESQLFAPVDIDSLMRTVLGRSEVSAEQRSVTIQFRTPDGPLVAFGNHRELVSALSNLVENAIKYSPEFSVVTIVVQRAPSGSFPRRMIEFTVTDLGIGIPPRDRERIFERFYRVDRARARDTGGTGIGLAIVRHVAINHGGDVRVESDEGAGSTFTLVVPQYETE